MKNFSKYILVILVGFQLAFSGCEEDNYKLGELITPTNVDFTYEVVGVDGDNPYGDGSGIVTFAASADNEITFNYLFGDGQDNKIAPDGTISHQFTINGVNKYNVTVLAVGTGGISSSKTMQVEVLSTFEDVEALGFLAGGSSKTWYWAADQPGTIGLGPNDKAYAGGEHTFAFWFSSNPWHEDKMCMYDAEFVFTETNGSLTFEQTVGSAYVPGDYGPILGVDGNTCYGEDVVPSLKGVKNVAFIPSSSIATVDGQYRGTTLSFSDGGFMCWYVGASTHEIIKLTDNIMTVRIEENGTRAWYCSFSTTKPVQP
jgi:hypothetical protein